MTLVSDSSVSQFFAALFSCGQTFSLCLSLGRCSFINVHVLILPMQVSFSMFSFSRPDLKVILMSATLNSEMFSAYFGMKTD